MSFLFNKQLNKPQQLGVATLDGPLLILAGAGSGKTRVLTYRIVNLICQQKATPEKILAVTFTNKAASEMKHRCLSLLSEQGISVVTPPWIGTFHALGAFILRSHVDCLGYKTSFNICDSGEQLQTVKRMMTKLRLNDKTYPPKQLQNQINKAKRLAILPHQVKMSLLGYDSNVIELYKIYESEMKKTNNLDFADLLLKTYLLFDKNPGVLESYKDTFQFIHVDEYQDTNHIQYLILQQLAGTHRNLCVVGDEDQSIYGWRGADIRNILDFEKDYPEAKVIKLEENYRSTQTIIKAASSLISHNKERKGKVLFSNKVQGEKIVIQQESNERSEARRVIVEIKRMITQKGLKYSDFAIFYRTHAQSRILEEQFLADQIPHKLLGGIRFYERKEIKDLLSYLKFLLNPEDNIAFFRIVNTPIRGIGRMTLQKIEDVALQNGVSMVEASRIAISQGLLPKVVLNSLERFLDLMSYLKTESHNLSLSEIYDLILNQTQYLQRLKQTTDQNDAKTRIENLEELHSAIKQFEDDKKEKATLQAFLERTSLMNEGDGFESTSDYVTLMTLHVSKGLEFPCVFIVGMEEGLFPTSNALDSLESKAVEEERRLAYVGMTRAKERLYLTYVRERKSSYKRLHPMPSRFLTEIPGKYVKSTTFIKNPYFVDCSDSLKKPHSYNFKQRHHSHANLNDFDRMPNYEEEKEPYLNHISKGSRVRHSKFGEGTIYKAEGQGSTQKVTVVFDDNSIKKFMTKHAGFELL